MRDFRRLVKEFDGRAAREARTDERCHQRQRANVHALAHPHVLVWKVKVSDATNVRRCA
jgi:hypothetical protein